MEKQSSGYMDRVNASMQQAQASGFGWSVSRLRDFYKRFDFVENKGRNKDFSMRESMYRQHRNALALEP